MSTAISKAEGSAAKKLLQGLLTELALESPRYNSMSQEAQQEVIDRLRLQVEDAVRECVATIAADGSDALPVTIESMTFKDGCKVVLKGISTTTALSVASEVGSRALLVLCDPDAFMGDLDSVKGKPNQGDLVGEEGDQE
jgi:hypothetical protein